MQFNSSESRTCRSDSTVPARNYNVSRTLFSQRIAVDAISAGIAALTVSPIMTIIDRAVIESAARRTSVLSSMKTSFATLLRHPLRFCNNRGFSLMFVLYFGTYTTSNCADSLTAVNRDLPADAVTSSVPKFATVSGVNVGLSLWKDSEFARTFGVATAARIPMATYSTFLVRDSLTIFASFNLPPLLAPALPESWDSSIGRLTAAQFVCPAAMQAVVTPLHLLGLDFYNRHARLPPRERWKAIRGLWIPTSVARMCRIIPAYGLGGVVNIATRSALMDSQKPPKD